MRVGTLSTIPRPTVPHYPWRVLRHLHCTNVQVLLAQLLRMESFRPARTLRLNVSRPARRALQRAGALRTHIDFPPSPPLLLSMASQAHGDPRETARGDVPQRQVLGAQGRARLHQDIVQTCHKGSIVGQKQRMKVVRASRPRTKVRPPSHQRKNVPVGPNALGSSPWKLAIKMRLRQKTRVHPRLRNLVEMLSVVLHTQRLLLLRSHPFDSV
jgi:hypothetical protein